MRRELRLLAGISVFWLALSVLFDGVSALVLPLQLGEFANQDNPATALGLLTFVGLMAGALIQPFAGALSDRWRPLLGRKGFIAVGVLLSLISLFIFGNAQNILAVAVGYLALQISTSIAQAGQQGLIPDLVDEKRRGLASGLKGFMDLTGAMLGFIVLGQLLGSGKPSLAIGTMGGILIGAYVLAVWLTPEDGPRKGVAVKTTSIPLNEVFRLDVIQNTGFVRVVLSRFLFLLGIYGIGRFLLLFVAARLGLEENEAAEQAGTLLAGLAFITILASPVTGWLADRFGRMPLMIAGAILSAISALMLVWAGSANQILLFGALMSIGSAAFAGGSWALLADLVPKGEPARFMGLANFSTAGSAAVAGLFGPLIDGVERMSPGMGFPALFLAASLAFLASMVPLKGRSLKESEEGNGHKRKDRSNAGGLAFVSLQADSATTEEDQDP